MSEPTGYLPFFSAKNKILHKTTPPKFCTEDGLELIEDTQKMHGGFDPVTGKRNKDTVKVTRRCPTGSHTVWTYKDEKELWYKR